MPAEDGEWGGKVQRVVSGESQEFHDWPMLVDTLRTMLAATSPPTDGVQDIIQPGPTRSLDTEGERQ